MPSPRSALVNVLLVAAVALSGFLVNVPAQIANHASPSMVNPSVAAKGNHDHRRDHKQANRKRDRKSSQRNASQSDPTAQPVPTVREGDWKSFCDDDLKRLNQSELCTHGADTAAQFDLGKDDAKASSSTAQDSASVACDGDGQAGFRVQALYVRGTSGSPLSDSLTAELQTYLTQANQIFLQAAVDTGGVRNLRFVQAPGGSCLPDIDEVVMPTSGVGNLNAMISQLQSENYDRTDRIYLAFADADTYCGIGTIWSDDRPDSDNWNNVGPSYSRVDTDCWSGQVAAHELTHNLGGVQDSAPNTSLGYHCIDEYDVMCYSDAPYHPQVHYVCPQQPLYPGNETLDCHHDDYFNVNPPAGSYLDTCWNTANNQFLIGANALPSSGPTCVPAAPSDFSSPSINLTVPTTTGPQRDVSLSATASDNVNVASVAFGFCSGSTCGWSAAQSLGTVGAEPYTVSWKAPKKGTFTFLALATDPSGNTGLSNPATLRVNAKNKGSKHKHGGHKGNGNH